MVLDELGHLPFSASGGTLFFHLLSKLYKRTSVVVIITNLSFSEWAGVFRRYQDDDRLARLPHPTVTSSKQAMTASASRPVFVSERTR